jgi:hypothetical protein
MNVCHLVGASPALDKESSRSPSVSRKEDAAAVAPRSPSPAAPPPPLKVPPEIPPGPHLRASLEGYVPASPARKSP